MTASKSFCRVRPTHRSIKLNKQVKLWGGLWPPLSGKPVSAGKAAGETPALPIYGWAKALGMIQLVDLSPVKILLHFFQTGAGGGQAQPQALQASGAFLSPGL